MSHWHIPSKRVRPQPWTDEDWQKAQILKAEGLDAYAIGARLNRSGRAVRAKFEQHNLTPEQRQRRAESARTRRDLEVKSRQVAGMTFYKAPTADTVNAFTTRNERLAIQPRDLTASIMGDPLPGYSALERRS